MGEQTAIAWTHDTFNPWWGCTRVSPACDHCYAESFAKRTGHAVWGADAPRRVISDKTWNDPRRWNATVMPGERRLVFCASMADVFEAHDGPMVDHKGEVLPGRSVARERARLWELIEDTPNLTWQVLTKRPENIRSMVPEGWLRTEDVFELGSGRRTGIISAWPTNVWIGTTVENQRQADLRVPHLVDVPAGVRFLSCEPLLGPLDLSRWLSIEWMDALRLPGAPLSFRGEGGWGREMFDAIVGRGPKVHWVICGGESGGGRRPLNHDHARDLRDQCAAAEIDFFFKQDSGLHPGTPGPPDLDEVKQLP